MALFSESPISWPEYYKECFINQEAAERYLQVKRETRDALFLAIKSNISPGSHLLEAGCGTSTASVILNKDGYKNTAVDSDDQMLDIAKDLNKKMETGVHYEKSDIFSLNFPNDSFSGVFSHGVIEHFNEEKVIKIVNEGLRVAAFYILSFPTICNRSPDLRGDENPWTYFKWKNVLRESDVNIKRIYAMYSKRPIRESINVAFNRNLTWFAPNLVFVISRL